MSIRTLSGHPAVTSWGSLLLRAAKVPGPYGNGVTLRTRRFALPLFLNVAKRLSIRVQPLNPRNCWSYNYRPARMGAGVSDHAGFAIDLWTGTVSGPGGEGIGAHTWPSRMSAEDARTISRELERYRTKDGRHVFGWGACRLAPGVTYSGPLYSKTTSHDPQHIYLAPGITRADVREVRRRMKIDRAGNAHPETE